MRPELFKIPGTEFVVPGYGAAIVIAFLVGTWWMTRRAVKVKADPDVVLSLALISLIFGWLGGRVFYVVHYWKTQFAHNPAQIFNLTAGGFEVYGGVILSAVACIAYLAIRRLPIRLYADLAAPTLLFGMGIGRIGCFLVGCCWGALCPPSLPWAVQFPAGSYVLEDHWAGRIVTLPAEAILVMPNGMAQPIWQIEKNFLKNLDEKGIEEVRKRFTAEQARLATMPADAPNREINAYRLEITQSVLSHFDNLDITPGELRRRIEARQFVSAHVHPAQIYSAIGPLLLAWMMNALFYRRKRHGVVFALTMVLYGFERFIEEMVRMDNPQDTFGLTISQGISILVVAGGALWLLILQKMPLRSSRPAILAKKQALSSGPEVQASA